MFYKPSENLKITDIILFCSYTIVISIVICLYNLTGVIKEISLAGTFCVR